MTGIFANGHAARCTKWLALLAAATSLSGCMVSALETASIYPAPTEQGFGYAAPAAPAEAITAMAGSEPASAGASNPFADSADASVQASASMSAPTPANDVAEPVDPATARIYAAVGSAPTPAPAPAQPLAGIAKRTSGLLAMFSHKPSSGGARTALVPPAPLPQESAQAEAWSAPTTNDTTAARATIASANLSSLPGVDRDRVLGLKSSSEDTAPSSNEPVRVASAAGLARLAPNGLRVQNSGVDVNCLKPALVKVLNKIERHYGRDVVVTSGYRNPTRNKKASGSENSLHMYCSAADIQIEGVSKWELASYLRSMPGRGGVGTYCHTESVHIDIGPARDWNWRCRRKK
ncbi:D-Ala-D-Ala carboxypeptidase family metallohydrolase [Oricola sp.]|uniref:YcbK family protein n=1 Tax=Oricola sp. TaxID=1979950 RepID=UPI0025F3B81A|nr:D-Ala-D-Ala carboxypeptidase family metallohydrolase [Oricola sp.]